MRIAVVDMGSNSTRLLVVDVDSDSATMLDRRTTVTRLAEGVDRTGRLSDEAIGRVERALAEYRNVIEDLHAQTTIGVLTSATRDAANGDEFVARVRDVYRIDARVIPGEEEARLTFRGATYGREDIEHTAVVDIGGGSTEIVTGGGFRTSLQMGVVRFSERHLHHDPPQPEELQGLTAAVRAVLAASLPARPDVNALIAVAGTATTAAAIAHDIEPYDPDRVHRAHIALGDLEEILARLAILPLAERREVRGLHPDRAPTIVAGIAILLEATRAFGLDELEISEHDLLLGAALDEVDRRAGTG
ncbi:MAG TPA: Ppx/GppA family phosphatase [Solirubrobacteraceae bacterium]|nr:Ppx/GppA family phosphatase [Solirubrobacteraceae bacterium]